MQNIQPYLVPLAIIIAGALIAGAVILNGGGTAAPTGPDTADLVEMAKNTRPVDATDHIRGDANAPVTIIEYSDFECPYCGSFHPVMQQIVSEYAGQVRWIYRHLPLYQIHPQAIPAALASECVAELGGNEAFWTVADGLIENQQTLNASLYERLATEAGVPLAAFQTCMTEERHKARVEADMENALESGAQGTPYAVILTAGKDPLVIPGAYPYEAVKSAVDEALE